MSFDICGTNPMLDDTSINVTYDEILAMSHVQFLAYIRHMRSTVLRLWDERGIAPARGWSKWDVTDEFKQLADFPVHKFWVTDELSGRRVINNTHTVGNAVNAWTLGQMLKTRINYTEKDNGRSIYDFFSRDELFKRYLPYARRHFLRDSFYFFAQSVGHDDELPHRAGVRHDSPVAYCRGFAEHERPYGTHELLIEPKKCDVVYTGYAGHLNTQELLTDTFRALTLGEVNDLARSGVLPPITLRLIRKKELNDQHAFHIRLYEKGQRVFPRLFSSFRVSVCQYAVNFPPLTAKLIYDTFLKDVPGKALVWDPSAGWAGRLLGAMASSHDLHYIGTDPNSAFYDDETSMYAEVAKFYNDVRSGQSLFGEQNTADIFKHGSENFNEEDAFKLSIGKGDLVFTSPPYWNREGYSEDETQSYKKFGAYASWRDGFLRPTLQNAWDFLKPNRYLLWNIADLKVGKEYVPLEQDSIDIAKSLGFEYVEMLSMTLKGMPGANRSDGDTITAKNMVKVNGRVVKCENIFVFRKP
jgi:hypothetical protein